jgi:hypothetical protein
MAVSGGLFEVKFFGNLPFVEIEDGKRYRATFFSRQGDFSISHVEGMTYL